MTKILFFFFFTLFLFAEIDYIDYEDTYDSEAYYNVSTPVLSDENKSLEKRMERLDAKIRQLEERIQAVSSGNYSLDVLQRKTIYLTFDDGPLSGTEHVLQVLEEEQVPATFFFVGEHIEKENILFEKAKRSSYALIANHTYSHASGHYRQFYQNPRQVLADIDKAQCLIGMKQYQRLAGRNVWRLASFQRDDHALMDFVRNREKACYDIVADAGYHIFGWDIEWEYTQRTGRPLWSAREMFQRIITRYRHKKLAKKGRVVLLAHDFMFRGSVRQRKELQKLIVLLRNDGWQFDTVDHYIR